MISSERQRQVDRLRARASDLAATLGPAARAATTPAQQRAVLRLFGVDGLDRAGRPLVSGLLEAYCGEDPSRLAAGIALPFAVALLEYDVGPRQLALDAVSGAIDLRLEAELLDRPDRRAAAEQLASSLAEAAFGRFEANHTASIELQRLLGEPETPLLAVALRESSLPAARREARQAAAAGAGAIRVEVPASSELAAARADAVPEGIGNRATGRPVVEGHQEDRFPAGSQRGLAVLRRTIDEASAQRGAYVRLITVASGFGAPEQAVVAGFERIDVVEADPMREIVEDNVDPERALADHAFAHRLHLAAGCQLVIGPGPLVVGRDLARGEPPDPIAWAGRSLALQALAVELCRGDGMPDSRLLVGASPAWMTGSTDPNGWLVQAWLRRAVFPELRIALEESGIDTAPRAWPSTSLAALAAAGSAFLVMAQPAAGSVGPAANALRAASAAAAALAAGLGDGRLHGAAAERATATLRAADGELELLAAEGWPAVLGDVGAGSERRLAARLVERAGAFDPLGSLAPA